MAGLKAYGFWPRLVPGEVPGAAVFGPPKLNKPKGEAGAAPNPAIVGVVEVGDVVEGDVVDVVDVGLVLGEPGAGNEDAVPNGDIPKAPGAPPASRSTADIWSIC